MQPYAMVFQRTGGSWKLAAAVQYPSGGARWPALCSQGTANNRARCARTGPLYGLTWPGC